MKAQRGIRGIGPLILDLGTTKWMWVVNATSLPLDFWEINVNTSQQYVTDVRPKRLVSRSHIREFREPRWRRGHSDCYDLDGSEFHFR